MDITNLTGLEKPLTKLLEEISKGIGILYEPTKIRRKALAEADALKIKSDAINAAVLLNPASCALALSCENEKIDFKDVSDTLVRAREMENFKALREQQNIESVLSYSIKHIQDGASEISDEPIDSDWRSRFFNKAKDVSYEQMQEVWGKVLAEEVKKPGTFSLRSLEVLSNLSNAEAELFRKISTYFEIESGFAITHHNKVGQIGLNELFPYRAIIELQDCGLITTQESLSFHQVIKKNQNFILKYNHGSLCLKNSANDVSVKFSILKLTSVGRELLILIDSSPWKINYIEEIQKYYHNLQVTYKPN